MIIARVCAMDRKPTEKELQDVAKELGARYRPILLNLDIKKNKIDTLKGVSRNSDDILLDGLVFWHHGNGLSPINWTTLLTAVQKAEYPVFAEEKRKELLQKDIHAMDKKPTEKELLDVVKEVGAGYQAILVNLNIQKSKIESFESTRKPDVICFDGLVFWRDGNGLQPINWNTLLSAVQKAGYPDFAEEKRKELQKDQQKKDHQNPPPPGTKADPDIGPKQVEKPKDICFAIVTANKNEWNSARHFLGAKGCDVSDSIKDRKCEEELNVVFESKKFGSYSLLRVYGKKGVIFQCPEMGSYSRGGSQYAVFMLLKEAMKNRWPLQVIFIVGCCGGVSAPDSKEKVEGTVFVANSFYQYAGKIEQDKRIKIKLSSHNAEMDWIHYLIASEEGGSEGYKVDRVEEVPFFSGDFVIKDEDFAQGLHELLQGRKKVGYEMEGIGAIRGVALLQKFKELLENVPNPPVLVVKGVSDTAGSDKNKEAPIRFFSKIEEGINEDTRQQMCTMMSLTLVLRAIKAAVDVGTLK